MNSELDVLPLRGLRVIDLVEGTMGSIGRTMAEWGATVIRVEPRSGGADRKAQEGGPTLQFALANLGKSSVALDLDDPADLAQFHDLARAADILIEDHRLRCPGQTSLDIDKLAQLNPGLVTLSLGGFGANTSYAEWQVTDPVLHAMSGELSRSGLPGREPLLPPGELALHCAAGQALLVGLAAHYGSTISGVGDRLDMALIDGTAAALDPGYGSSGSAAQGVPASKLPRGRPEARFQYPIIACADGYVRICMLAPRQWQAMFEWLGRPDEFSDPSFNTLRARYKSKTLIPRIAELFAGSTCRELETEAKKRGLPLATVVSLEQAVHAPQFLARKALFDIELSPGLVATAPNGIVEFDGKRAGIAGPPPDLGSSQGIITGGWPHRQREANINADTSARLPLKGLRVLDLGVIVVGAETGRLLGDLGADVIKIENKSFPDGSRQTRGEPISVSFAVGHRNQRSCGLNLRSEKGKALFFDLASMADVVLTNFKPGTLESLGLAPEALLARNPRLIIVDSSAFGPTGPESRRMGFGPLVRASAGLSQQWRYPDDPASFSDALTVYPDHICGRIGAAGVIALLLRRQRTGRGGTLSISQAEVMLGHMAAEIAKLSIAPSAPDVVAQASEPWGAFACAGEDEWCVVTARNEHDREAICGLIGRGDHIDRDDQVALKVELTAWMAERSPDEAAALLQSAGIPAGPMLRVADLPLHPYFRERGFLRLVSHPKIAEPFYAENMVVEAARLPRPEQVPAPMQGEHTLQLAREWLALDEGQIKDLVAVGVLEPYEAISDSNAPDSEH